MGIRYKSIMASAAMLLAAQAVHGQEDAQTTAAETKEEKVATLDEVVVTARRRSESLQKVPVAVSVFNEAQIEQQGIRDSSDIASKTPSLYIEAGSFSSSNTNIALRGITSPGANVSFDPTIGIYIDDVYMARNYGTLFDYFDVGNVQVLRGVQGTLFGRNNTGGAILINTVAPQMSNDGKLDISLGNYNYRRVDAIGNFMLVPNVMALRVGAMSITRDGYGKNVANGDDLGDRDVQAVRASLLYTPNEDAEFRLTYDYSRRDQSGPIFSPRSPTGRVVRPGLGFYDVAYDSNVFDRGNDKSLTGLGRMEFGNVTAKLILNKLSGTETINQDVDATDYTTSTLGNLNLQRLTDHDQSSAEFQLSGSGFSDRLNWVGGLYSLSEKAYQPTLNLGTRSETQLRIDNSSRAAFAHADFDMTERLQIGGGVRYTADEKGLSYRAFNTTSQLCVPASVAIRSAPEYDPSTCTTTVGKDNGYVSWDATINYEATPGIMLYARTGKGQKSGGYNSAITNVTDLIGYDPEIATDYELGFKSELLDRHLRLNGALFQTDYADIQRTRLVLVGTTTVIAVENAAEARIRGAEIDAEARFDSGLTLGANYSYTDPKFTKFTSLNSSGGIVDQTHFPFNYVSKHQLGINLGYNSYWEGKGEFSANIGYSYRSDYTVYPQPDTAMDQDGYGTLSARMSFSPDRFPNLQLAIWGRNLTDEEYITGGSSSGAVRFVIPGQPRMVGLDIKLKFGAAE